MVACNGPKHSETPVQERLARLSNPAVYPASERERALRLQRSMTSGGIPNIRWPETRVQLRLSFATRQNFSEEPMDVV